MWDFLIQNIKGAFENADNKEWLKGLIDDLERKYLADESFPFRIKQIKEKGFVVKINGLFAFISFNHMSWQYDDPESWKHVFKYLQDKTFFCKVHKFEKEPLSITVNGRIPQFKKLSLSTDSEYEGVIIKKSRNGMYVDFGYHFDWHCGSFVQMVHKSDIDKEDFSELQCGEVFKAFYTGESTTKIAAFKSEKRMILEDYMGKLVRVHVRKNVNDLFTYLVDGKYPAAMPVSKEYYPEQKNYIRQALSNLNDGEIIHCEVVNITKYNQIFHLKWVMPDEIKNAFEREPIDVFSKNASNNIQEKLEDDVFEKLKIIGQQVDVEVIKKEDKTGKLFNKYLVGQKYQGDLLIANENYHISDKEKALIEENFQDSEMLKCTVISIDKNKAKIKWNISDFDFVRFIKND